MIQLRNHLQRLFVRIQTAKGQLNIRFQWIQLNMLSIQLKRKSFISLQIWINFRVIAIMSNH